MLELTLPCVGLASHLQGEVIHQDASCYGTAAIKSGNGGLCGLSVSLRLPLALAIVHSPEFWKMCGTVIR